MTWASLWWRVCLLGRMHRRHLSLAWRLWKRSRRAARPVRLPASDPRSSQYVPYVVGKPGTPVMLYDYRAVKHAYMHVDGAWLELGAQQSMMAQQAQQAHQDAQMQQMKQMMNMNPNSPQYLALLAGAQNALSGAGGI